MGLQDLLGMILGGGNAPSPFPGDPITPSMPTEQQPANLSLMQRGNRFATNPSLFSAPSQPAQTQTGGQKPLGFLNPTLNKVPGLQGLGNMMSKDNYILPKIMNMVGGAMQYKNPMRKVMPAIGDVLAGQSLNNMGQTQGQQPVAQTPSPQSSAQPKALPAAEVTPQTSPQPTGKNFPSLMGGYTPGQSSSQDVTLFQPQKPSFSNSQQVSGGTVGSPDMATPPTVGQNAVEQGPMSMPREITNAVIDAARYNRPTIDPWVAGMMTGIRPGTNPSTGYTAGNEYTRMALAEGDLAAKRSTDLMKSYAATMEAGNKPLLQYWQGMEHQAKFRQIMGDPQVQAAASRLKYLETMAEGQAKNDAKQEAITALYNNPMLKGLGTTPELRQLGITNMAQVAAMAETGDANVLANVVKNVGQLASARVNAAARIEAANISAGAHMAASKDTSAQIQNQILKNFGAEIGIRLKSIEANFYDPSVTKPNDLIALKKKPMTPDIKAEYEGLKGTHNVIVKQFGELANTVSEQVGQPKTDQYDPRGQGTQRKPEAIGETPTGGGRRRVPTVGGRTVVQFDQGRQTGYLDSKGNIWDAQTGGKIIGTKGK
jgi:hypothetical protein